MLHIDHNHLFLYCCDRPYSAYFSGGQRSIKELRCAIHSWQNLLIFFISISSRVHLPLINSLQLFSLH